MAIGAGFSWIDEMSEAEVAQDLWEQAEWRRTHPLTLADFGRSFVVADAALEPRRLPILERSLGRIAAQIVNDAVALVVEDSVRASRHDG